MGEIGTASYENPGELFCFLGSPKGDPDLRSPEFHNFQVEGQTDTFRLDSPQYFPNSEPSTNLKDEIIQGNTLILFSSDEDSDDEFADDNVGAGV